MGEFVLLTNLKLTSGFASKQAKEETRIEASKSHEEVRRLSLKWVVRLETEMEPMRKVTIPLKGGPSAKPATASFFAGLSKARLGIVVIPKNLGEVTACLIVSEIVRPLVRVI